MAQGLIKKKEDEEKTGEGIKRKGITFGDIKPNPTSLAGKAIEGLPGTVSKFVSGAKQVADKYNTMKQQVSDTLKKYEQVGGVTREEWTPPGQPMLSPAAGIARGDTTATPMAQHIAGAAGVVADPVKRGAVATGKAAAKATNWLTSYIGGAPPGTPSFSGGVSNAAPSKREPASTLLPTGDDTPTLMPEGKGIVPKKEATLSEDMGRVADMARGGAKLEDTEVTGAGIARRGGGMSNIELERQRAISDVDSRMWAIKNNPGSYAPGGAMYGNAEKLLANMALEKARLAYGLSAAETTGKADVQKTQTQIAADMKKKDLNDPDNFFKYVIENAPKIYDEQSGTEVPDYHSVLKIMAAGGNKLAAIMLEDIMTEARQ